MATLNGTPEDDLLKGTLEADSIFGLAGNDRLSGNQGNDRVFGGTGDDRVYGGRGSDRLGGGRGNDNLRGNQGSDRLSGGAGNDSLFGGIGSDRLNGGDGNDTLTGNSFSLTGQIDTLIGGGGNDTYIIGSTVDTITEAADSGTDTVQSSISYTLGSNLENLTLTGFEVLNGTGNNLNNTIVGNDGDNILNGLAGNDVLDVGGSGDATLYGGDGDDTLKGGFSSQVSSPRAVLYGGDGNDTYIINDSYFGYSNTIIVEAANSGTDTVESSLSYTLVSNLENLTLTNFAGNGTGNDLNNTIIGNDIDNFLNAGGGSDLLNAGAGNDFLVGSSGAVGERDTLTGGTGRDTFLLGNVTQVFYDDRNSATAGTGDYALITDLNKSDDVIQLNGSRTDYRLAASPAGLPVGTVIYRNQPGAEPDELIAIVQGSSGLNLNGNYFNFTADEFNLSTLNGSNGFVINGIDEGDRSGVSVSEAGDVNGDGLDDLIIGAYRADPNGQSFAGESYVVFGSSGGFSADLNLSTLNGSNGFTINGIDSRDYSGNSVSSAGDINGDGFDDLIIGTFRADSNGQNYAGESYVVFGSSGGFSANLNLSDLDGSNGFVINGIDESDYSGRSVSSAGDVNGDGVDDLIIGAFGADPNGQSGAGESYVVFGKREGFDASLNLSDLNGSNGFQINGIDAIDLSGLSVSSAGDVNDDSFDDLIIGALGADPNGQNFAGESYVIFGRADFTTAALNVGTLEPFNQLLASNTGNAVMPSRQNLPFGSTTATDNIFFDLHNAGISPLLGGTDIT